MPCLTYKPTVDQHYGQSMLMWQHWVNSSTSGGPQHRFLGTGKNGPWHDLPGEHICLSCHSGWVMSCEFQPCNLTSLIFKFVGTVFQVQSSFSSVHKVCIHECQGIQAKYFSKTTLSHSIGTKSWPLSRQQT